MKLFAVFLDPLYLKQRLMALSLKIFRVLGASFQHRETLSWTWQVPAVWLGPLDPLVAVLCTSRDSSRDSWSRELCWGSLPYSNSALLIFSGDCRGFISSLPTALSPGCVVPTKQGPRISEVPHLLSGRSPISTSAPPLSCSALGARYGQ